MDVTAHPETHPVRRRAVDRSVDHILRDLAGPLDLTAIAAVGGYSRSHFQRIFSDVMGESPAAFVARARIERAVAIARAEPQRLWLDIANEVGFANASQLSRAFRQRFGRPPRAWDRASPLVDRDRRIGDRTSSLVVSQRSAGDERITVRLEWVEGFRFVYRRVRDAYAPGHLADAWEEVDGWRSQLDPTAVVMGMSWDDPATVPPELCRYDLGIALDARHSIPSDASDRWVPSTTAAIVRVDGDIAAVDDAWNHLHRTWLPVSPWRRSALPSIERLLSDPRPGWDRWRLDCVLPVTAGGERFNRGRDR